MLLHARPEAEVKMYGDLLDADLSTEMALLNRRYERLWKLQVFVDPTQAPPDEVSNAATQQVHRLCEALFKMPNENRAFRGGYGADSVRDIFLSAAQRLKGEQDIAIDVDVCLAAASANGRKGPISISEAEAMRILKDLISR